MADALIALGLGLLALLLGTDSLQKGVSGLAQRLGASPFRAGVAMLGLGSALPQLAIVARARWTGHPDLAAGTAFGSAVAAVGLALAVTLAVTPLPVTMRALARQGQLAVVTVLALFLLAIDGGLSAIDGAVLLALFAAGQVLLWRSAPAEAPGVQLQFTENQFTQTEVGRTELRIAIGLAALGFGAYKCCDAAVAIATAVGASEVMVGLTVVAAGSTLPALVAALMAARNDQPDVAVGSAIGAFGFNLAVLVGGSAVIAPVALGKPLLGAILPELTAAAILLALSMTRPGVLLKRGVGALLTACWLAALVWQWLELRG